MRKNIYATAGAVTLLAALAVASPAQAANGHHRGDDATAKLSALHGVPGLTG
jgi:hypothetical protein